MHGVEMVNKGDIKDIRKNVFQGKMEMWQKIHWNQQLSSIVNYAAPPIGHISKTLARLSNF